MIIPAKSRQKSDERQRRRLEHLQLLKKARRVQRPEIAAELGVTVGQVSDIFRGGTELGTESLSLILEKLSVDEAEFHAGVQGRFHAEVYLAEVERSRSRQAEHVEALTRKSPSRPYTVDELYEMAEGLQELRLLDIETARRQALDILASDFHGRINLSASALCKAYVALGAIYRARGNYGGAAFFLRQALYTADSDALRAPALQAVGSLARDFGDLDKAIEVVVQAAYVYLKAVDFSGLGRALISLGALRLYAGDLTTARASLQSGLKLVNSDLWFVRYAALQNLAFCHLYRAELREALDAAELGLKVVNAETIRAPLLRASILWLRGEAYLAAYDAENATKDLREVLDIYLKEQFSALDCALVATRLANAFLLAGDSDALQRLVSQVSSLVKRFKKSEKLLQATFSKLLGQAQENELTVDILLHAYRTLLEGAERAPREAQLPLLPKGSKRGPAASRLPTHLISSKLSKAPIRR